MTGRLAVQSLAGAYCVLGCVVAYAQVPPGFTQLELPQAVTVKQEIQLAPAKWQAGRDTAKHIVKSITVFDGPPSEQASLVPDNEADYKKSAYTLWTFEAKNPRQIWVQVEFARTSVTLAQALPKGTTELRVYYDRNISVEGNKQVTRVVFR